jgi:hypothetical protein
LARTQKGDYLANKADGCRLDQRLWKQKNSLLSFTIARPPVRFFADVRVTFVPLLVALVGA